MTIEIVDGGRVREELARQLEKAISFAVQQETGGDNFEVCLSLTDGEGIRKLNCEYRGMDKETDVLSFPLLERKPGQRGEFWDEQDIDPQTNEVMLGDIVLSVEAAHAQAEEYGHSLEREAVYLCVHSVLHLLGYDHIQPEDKLLMRRREEEIMDALGLGRETAAGTTAYTEAVMWKTLLTGLRYALKETRFLRL